MSKLHPSKYIDGLTKAIQLVGSVNPGDFGSSEEVAEFKRIAMMMLTNYRDLAIDYSEVNPDG